MCGIVGYTGCAQAAPVLLDGLEKLEYRGYDSAGICIHNGSALTAARSKGRLKALREKTEFGAALPGMLGIGHTRWATHGAPSEGNAHPHLSASGSIAVVHNGIIENEAPLRRWLESEGVSFRSETDTEVVPNLIGYYYEKGMDLMSAVRTALSRLEGSWALGILCADRPQTLIAAKKASPLVVGFGSGEMYLASDVTALIAHTRTVAYLQDGDIAVLTHQTAVFYDESGKIAERPQEHIAWEAEAAERGGYDHFMLKEIHEQPRAFRDTVAPRIRHGQIELDIDLPAKDVQRICLVACGSSHYVSVLAKYTIEQVCRIPTEAVLASEFRYSSPLVDGKTLVIAISQSGETADTLAALREAKAKGAQTLAIVNVVGSAVAKEADRTIYTWAGPEIAVATTKAFTTQLAVVYLVALRMARELGTVTEEAYHGAVSALERMPDDLCAELTEDKVQNLRRCAKDYANANHAFFIGRNLDSAVCMEGSLKLKEIAYLHSEAYPAGELKHGPISLVEEGTLVIAVATVSGLFGKTLANIREVKARGARVVCITLEEFAEEVSSVADRVITVGKTLPMLQSSLSLIPLQLFAYYMALERGCDVDKPRNLAKSVTVE